VVAEEKVLIHNVATQEMNNSNPDFDLLEKGVRVETEEEPKPFWILFEK